MELFKVILKRILTILGLGIIGLTLFIYFEAGFFVYMGLLVIGLGANLTK